MRGRVSGLIVASVAWVRSHSLSLVKESKYCLTSALLKRIDLGNLYTSITLHDGLIVF